MFRNAIKNLIKKSKYLPKISEIIEACKSAEDGSKHEVLEYMNNKGYFKTALEYEKACRFVERNIIPDWFLEAMRKYYMMMITETKQLGDNSQKQLNMESKLLTI